MKITILHYYCGYIDGVFTSIIDTYYNLKHYGIDVDLKIISYENIANTITHISNNFNDYSLLKLTKDLKYDSDIIICSACLLYNNFETPLPDLTLKAKHIYVLDSSDIYLSKNKINSNYGIIPPLHTVNYNNIILLANKANLNSCECTTFEYYHKFSKDRLDNKKHRENILHPYKAIFNYSKENRCSASFNENNGFSENIGKSIFELIYLDRIVNYKADKYIKDGLHYYLKLFNVDATKDYHPLPISKTDVFDKLFMKEDDLLLDMIKDNQ